MSLPPLLCCYTGWSSLPFKKKSPNVWILLEKPCKLALLQLFIFIFLCSPPQTLCLSQIKIFNVYTADMCCFLRSSFSLGKSYPSENSVKVASTSLSSGPPPLKLGWTSWCVLWCSLPFPGHGPSCTLQWCLLTHPLNPQDSCCWGQDSHSSCSPLYPGAWLHTWHTTARSPYIFVEWVYT